MTHLDVLVPQFNSIASQPRLWIFSPFLPSDDWPSFANLDLILVSTHWMISTDCGYRFELAQTVIGSLFLILM